MQAAIALVLARCFGPLGSESDLLALSLSLNRNQDGREASRGPSRAERALNAGCANVSRGRFRMQRHGGAESEPAWCFRLGSVEVGGRRETIHLCAEPARQLIEQ